MVGLLCGSATSRADSLPETDSIYVDSATAPAVPGIEVGWTWPETRFTLIDSTVAARFYAMKWVEPSRVTWPEPGKKQDELDTYGAVVQRWRSYDIYVGHSGVDTSPSRRHERSKWVAVRDVAHWYRMEPVSAVSQALPGVDFYLSGNDWLAFDAGILPVKSNNRQLLAVLRGRVYSIPERFPELLRDAGCQFTEADVSVWLRAYVVCDAIAHELAVLQMAGSYVGGSGFRQMLFDAYMAHPPRTRADSVRIGTGGPDFSLPSGSVVTVSARPPYRGPDGGILIPGSTVVKTQLAGVRQAYAVEIEFTRETDSAGRVWVVPNPGWRGSVLDWLRGEVLDTAPFRLSLTQEHMHPACLWSAWKL